MITSNSMLLIIAGIWFWYWLHFPTWSRAMAKIALFQKGKVEKKMWKKRSFHFSYCWMSFAVMTIRITWCAMMRSHDHMACVTRDQKKIPFFCSFVSNQLAFSFFVTLRKRCVTIMTREECFAGQVEQMAQIERFCSESLRSSPRLMFLASSQQKGQESVTSRVVDGGGGV